MGKFKLFGQKWERYNKSSKGERKHLRKQKAAMRREGKAQSWRKKSVETSPVSTNKPFKEKKPCPRCKCNLILVSQKMCPPCVRGKPIDIMVVASGVMAHREKFKQHLRAMAENTGYWRCLSCEAQRNFYPNGVSCWRCHQPRPF